MSFNKVTSSSGPRFPFAQNIARKARNAVVWVAVVLFFALTSLTVGSVLVGENPLSVVIAFGTFLLTTGSITVSILQTIPVAIAGFGLVAYGLYMFAYPERYALSAETDRIYWQLSAKAALAITGVTIAVTTVGPVSIITYVTAFIGCAVFAPTVVKALNRDENAYGNWTPEWFIMLGTRIPLVVAPVFTLLGSPLAAVEVVTVLVVSPVIALLYGLGRGVMVRDTSSKESPDVSETDDDSFFDYE